MQHQNIDPIQSSRAGTYELMDVARALAATIVVFSHGRDLLLADYASAGNQGAVAKAFYFMSGFGHAGVIVFFVLSGFWITKSVTGRDGQPGFWARYLIDRLSRLWIVLIPALVLGGTLDAIGIHWLGAPLYRGATGAASITPDVAQALSISALVGNLAFVQTFAVPPLGSNGPLWSLAYEFWFYLWFPALWISYRTRRLSPILLTLLIGVLNPQIYLGFVSFLCGSALFAVVGRMNRNHVAKGVRWAVLCTGTAAFAGALVVARSRPSLWFDPVLALAFAWCLLGTFLVAPRPLRTLLPIARYGAGSSFSLYAIHFPIVALAAALLTADGRLPAEPRYMALVVALVIGVVVVARLFSRQTEARTGALRRRMRTLVGPAVTDTDGRGQ